MMGRRRQKQTGSLVEDAAAYPARADANGWDKTFSAGDNLTLGVCLAKSGDILIVMTWRNGVINILTDKGPEMLLNILHVQTIPK